jgi:hypothetical protein
MKGSEIIQTLFTYFKSSVEITLLGVDVSVCDLKEHDVLSKPLVVILPIRDPVAGYYVRQSRESLEIAITAYSLDFYNIQAQTKLDDTIRHLMRTWYNPPCNFRLVRRFYSRWFKQVSAYQSQQIYTFDFINLEE